jgi:hypothetical protein
VSTVISLCDLTGNFVRPWVEAGYDAILVDPQHGFTHMRFGTASGPITTKLAMTVEEALPDLGAIIRGEDVAFVAGFPPCTDLAGSGARWWAAKYAEDPMFQARAVAVAEQCRTVGQLSGAPWFVENPASALSRVFGKADHTFHPFEFTALEPADNYTKKTCLWTGGGFVMPKPQRDMTLGSPDDRIHKAPPSSARANFRSATPMGFARAVYLANARKEAAA